MTRALRAKMRATILVVRTEERQATFFYFMHNCRNISPCTLVGSSVSPSNTTLRRSSTAYFLIMKYGLERGEQYARGIMAARHYRGTVRNLNLVILVIGPEVGQGTRCKIRQKKRGSNARPAGHWWTSDSEFMLARRPDLIG